MMNQPSRSGGRWTLMDILGDIVDVFDFELILPLAFVLLAIWMIWTLLGGSRRTEVVR